MGIVPVAVDDGDDVTGEGEDKCPGGAISGEAGDGVAIGAEVGDNVADKSESVQDSTESAVRFWHIRQLSGNVAKPGVDSIPRQAGYAAEGADGTIIDIAPGWIWIEVTKSHKITLRRY